MDKQQVFELSLPENQAIEFSKHVAAIRGQVTKGNLAQVSATFSQAILGTHSDYMTSKISLDKYIDEIFKISALHHAAFKGINAHTDKK
ncbi:hypothetical protein [Burkholderia sp. LMG 13014]|uniref:hypothetical protein n=1 Tax=Burkholderia sp. LMG 13014 TaxID=2709306 RepID=UPI001963D489|nr:hypothetical protein [Burkholderia sp. LMG 13014]